MRVKEVSAVGKHLEPGRGIRAGVACESTDGRAFFVLAVMPESSLSSNAREVLTPLAERCVSESPSSHV